MRTCQPAAYVAAYRHVVDYLRQKGATNLRFIWGPAGDEEAVAYWPGADYVDAVGIDARRERQFGQPDLASAIGKTLQETGVDPSCVNLEITETIAMADADKSASVLGEFKRLGVYLSIDDFGTGYSSLSRLQGFPVDALKIDRAFISKLL